MKKEITDRITGLERTNRDENESDHRYENKYNRKTDQETDKKRNRNKHIHIQSTHTDSTR